jgi:Cdc6-like AAA superfamily ATPase
LWIQASRIVSMLKEKLVVRKEVACHDLRGKQTAVYREVSREKFDRYTEICASYDTMNRDQLEQEKKIVVQQLKMLEFMLSCGNSGYDPHEQEKFIYQKLLSAQKRIINTVPDFSVFSVSSLFSQRDECH